MVSTLGVVSDLLSFSSGKENILHGKVHRDIQWPHGANVFSGDFSYDFDYVVCSLEDETEVTVNEVLKKVSLSGNTMSTRHF